MKILIITCHEIYFVQETIGNDFIDAIITV